MHGQVARLSSSLETTVDRELDADIRGAQAGTEDQQDTTEEGITQEEGELRCWPSDANN